MSYRTHVLVVTQLWTAQPMYYVPGFGLVHHMVQGLVVLMLKCELMIVIHVK